ncbi:MAG: hypothetical protein IJJ83_11605 [Muribaculaceae bacterium]|nr:hypothetical protein [Muribaculaceae bacterium]
MDWLDLYVWQDAARDYLSVLDGNNKQATETISRLHSVIADIDINNIGKTLEQFNVNQTDIISDVDGWINTAQSLVERIGQNLPQFKSIDEKISEVFKFCNHLHDTLSFERDIFLIPRLNTDPTQGDEDAGERLKSYLNGDYGNIDFTLFYNQFININLLGTIAADDFDPEYHALLVHAERRRLNHLINICTDEHIKNTLSEMLDGVQCDIDTYYHVVPPIPTPDPETITAEATTPATSPIMELMLLDDDEQKQRLLDVLHKLVDKKKGKHVALVFLVCEKCGLMTKPTHQILTSIFGDIGTKSGYNNYYSKGLSSYTPEEIKGIETHILPFVNGQ